jgi:type III secretory pathway component EscU
MVSSASTSEFFKDDQISEKLASVCFFFKLHEKPYYYLLINIYENIMQSLLKTLICWGFCIISAGNCSILLAIFAIVSNFKPIKKPK